MQIRVWAFGVVSGRYRADFPLETRLWPINSAIR